MEEKNHWPFFIQRKISRDINLIPIPDCIEGYATVEKTGFTSFGKRHRQYKAEDNNVVNKT
jgi:hypothetical protein